MFSASAPVLIGLEFDSTVRLTKLSSLRAHSVRKSCWDSLLTCVVIRCVVSLSLWFLPRLSCKYGKALENLAIVQRQNHQ